MTTSYERANLQAHNIKLEKWRTYIPLSRDCFVDEIATHGMGKTGDRDQELTIIHRPTEIAALKHARYQYKFADNDPVIRQSPYIPMRYCILCKRHRPLEMFAYDARTPSKLGFSCKGCKDDSHRGIWRRVSISKAQQNRSIYR